MERVTGKCIIRFSNILWHGKENIHGRLNFRIHFNVNSLADIEI